MSESHSKLDKAMTTEQFTQVVEAILEGKYSWACVLILRFAGYNPLHYIPYRTYNRLMKENNLARKCQHRDMAEIKIAPLNSNKAEVSRTTSLQKIKDLGCLEVLNESQMEPHKIRGGSSFRDSRDWYLNQAFKCG